MTDALSPDAKPTVAAITGSQRDGSHTATAAQVALDRARAAGARTDHLDVGRLDLPLFDPDRPAAGDANELRDRIAAADAVLLATPMYHGSFASPLKTALDYATAEEFEGTVVGLLAVSGGGFPTPALEHLRAVCRSFDAWVLPNQVAVPDSHSRFADGELRDADLRDRLEALGVDLVTYAGVDAYPQDAASCAPQPGD